MSMVRQGGLDRGGGPEEIGPAEAARCEMDY